jgi:hypothetical protein
MTTFTQSELDTFNRLTQERASLESALAVLSCIPYIASPIIEAKRILQVRSDALYEKIKALEAQMKRESEAG